MCPVWGSDDNDAIDSVKGLMKADDVTRLLDEISPARPLIQPSIYGEPLLVPNLRERLAEMKSRGMTIAMNTNGLTLDDSIATYIVAVSVVMATAARPPVTGHPLPAIFAQWTPGRTGESHRPQTSTRPAGSQYR